MKEYQFSDFSIKDLIGSGQFSNVYLALEIKTNLIFAIKIIDIQSSLDEDANLAQEIKCQYLTQHINSIQLYGFFIEKNKIYLVMEYAQQGQLYKQLKNQKLSEEQASQTMKQIINAVDHLHKNNIIHRDLKLENILLSFNQIKICDFGWAIYTKQKQRLFCGTIDYLAPEIVQDQEYDKGVDIWALGVIAYELVAGKKQNFNAKFCKMKKLFKKKIKNYFINKFFNLNLYFSQILYQNIIIQVKLHFMMNLSIKLCLKQ